MLGLILTAFILRCVIRCVRRKRREKYWRNQELYNQVNEPQQPQPRKSKRQSEIQRKDVPNIEVESVSTSSVGSAFEEEKDGKFVARWSKVIEVRDGRSDKNSLK